MLEAHTKQYIAALLGPLLAAVAGNIAAEQFDYDHLGNRYQYTDKNGFVSSFTHNSINQYDQVVIDYPLVPDETRYFDYDNNGNLTDDGMDDLFEYDYRNRLISADIEQGAAVAYSYDALGRRICKAVGNNSIWYYYDLSGQVLAEYEQTTGSDPVLARSFVYGNGTDEILIMFRTVHEGDPDDWETFLDFCDAWLSTTGQGNFNATFDHDSDGKIDIKDFAYFASVWDTPSFRESDFYYLHDALGSVRGLIGGRYNRETDREFYNYDAYGQSSEASLPSVAGNPFLFAGYRYDAEANLYDLRNRTYDPIDGRFFQHDPIGYADSMNLYEYVLSNPANYTDPYGLFSRLHDQPSWTIGLDKPLSYFSQETRQKRENYRRQQEIMDEAYRKVEEVISGRCDKMKQCMQCAQTGQEIILAVVMGSGQGVANTVNGLQDSVIGFINLPVQACNLAIQPISDYQLSTLSSPDWAYGLVVYEDISLHNISKGVGATSAEFLAGIGTAKIVAIVKKGGDASKAKKAAECLKESLEQAGKKADDVVDLGNATKPKGWKVGDDIYSQTLKEQDPSRSTIRKRFWKNEAPKPDASDLYGAENVERMKKGLAPQRFNPDKGGLESMDLSHEPLPFRSGGKDVVPRWPQDHAKVDPYRYPGY